MTARPCLDCGTPTSEGNRCPACAPAAEARRQTWLRRQRGTTAARGYDAAWRQVAASVIRAEPWCCACGATEDLTCDHIVPLSQGGARLERDNLRVLCRRCHGQRSHSDRDGAA